MDTNSTSLPHVTSETAVNTPIAFSTTWMVGLCLTALVVVINVCLVFFLLIISFFDPNLGRFFSSESILTLGLTFGLLVPLILYAVTVWRMFRAWRKRVPITNRYTLWYAQALRTPYGMTTSLVLFVAGMFPIVPLFGPIFFSSPTCFQGHTIDTYLMDILPLVILPVILLSFLFFIVRFVWYAYKARRRSSDDGIAKTSTTIGGRGIFMREVMLNGSMFAMAMCVWAVFSVVFSGITAIPEGPCQVPTWGPPSTTQ